MLACCAFKYGRDIGVVDPQVLVIRFLMKNQQVVGTGDGAVHDARARTEMLVERKPIGDKLARLPACSVFSDVDHHILVPRKPCGVIDFHQLLGNGCAPRIVDRLKRYARHACIRLVKPLDDFLDNPAFRVRKSLPIAVFQKRDLAFLPPYCFWMKTLSASGLSPGETRRMVGPSKSTTYRGNSLFFLSSNIRPAAFALVNVLTFTFSNDSGVTLSSSPIMCRLRPLFVFLTQSLPVLKQ